MNRSILIVIVDFLLISLLAFARLDELEIKEDRTNQAPVLATGSTTRQDLMDVLKLSLDKERESREQVDEQLRQTQAQLQNKELALSDRERLIREAEQLLREKAEQAARLERNRASLEEQFAATQANISDLQKQLRTTLSEATLSRQKLDEVQSDLQAREEEQAVLQRRLNELENNQQTADTERQQLMAQLQVAEAEKRLVHEQLESTKGEVQIERQEKAKLQEHATKLAEGVSTLAEKSGKLAEGVTALNEKSTRLAEGVSALNERQGKLAEGVTSLNERQGKLAEGVSTLNEKSTALTQEIRENRPLAANTVFNDFASNRVRVDFRAVRSGVFGREINREKEFKTVMVRYGNQVYAVSHVNDTPLNLATPGIDWDWLIGNLRRAQASVRVERISFLAADPRIVVMPVSEAKARELGAKIYTIPKDPFKFQEAILVGANEGYYGECKFQMEVDHPQYVRMQRERFSWLVGKFQPSSGDLVFTKGGELLGLMVNKDYCLLLNEFAPSYHIQTGIGIGDQQTGLVLSQCFGQVARLPFKLQ